MIRCKIDVKKIRKDALFTGQKGTYCDITLMDNRDGPDEYGNDGFVVQDIGKERREAGEKGPIIGNWKYVQTRNSQQKMHGSERQRQPRDPDPIATYHKQHGTPRRDWNPPAEMPPDLPF